MSQTTTFLNLIKLHRGLDLSPLHMSQWETGVQPQQPSLLSMSISML